MAKLALSLVAAAALVLPASAPAALQYGMGDEVPTMFSTPLFTDLPISKARYVVAYDAALSNNFERQQADQFLRAARAAGYDLLVSFEHSRMPKKANRLPSTAAYQKGVRAFLKRYPYVRELSPWDEVNSCPEPTCKNPEAAAGYYKTLRQTCPQCTVMAAEVVDTTNPGATANYLRAYQRALGNTKPKLWGLHNYSDVNRFTSKGTKMMLDTVKGTIWLSETGGLYKFGSAFPASLSRQDRAARHMFSLARMSSRIARLYVYSWTGGGTFDAGLMSVSGTPRPAFDIFKSNVEG